MYDKRKAIRIVTQEAKNYSEQLENTSLLIIYKDILTNKIESIEVFFLAQNFQHLTGLLLKDIETNKVIDFCALQFYEKCLHSRLSENEIELQK